MSEGFKLTGFEDSTEAFDVYDKLKISRQKALDAGDDEEAHRVEGAMQTVEGSLDNDVDWNQDDLIRNKPLLDSYRIVWSKRNGGKTFQGSDEQLVDDYKGNMRWIENNLLSVSDLALETQDWSEEELDALGHTWGTWDKTNASVGGFFEGLAYTLLDPTTYAGIATLGIGTVASQGAKQAAKSGMLHLIKNKFKGRTAKTAAIGGADATAYSVGFDAAKQEALAPDADYDWGQGAQAGLFGLLPGTALGYGAGKYLTKNAVKTGNATPQDHYDEIGALDKVHRKAANIVRTDANAEKMGSTTGRVVGGVVDSLEERKLIGGVVKQFRKAVNTNLNVAEATPETVQRDIATIITSELKKMSGSRLFGAGMADAQGQGAKNKLIKSLGKKVYALVDPFKQASKVYKGTLGLGRNITGPISSHKARQLVKSGEPIRMPKTEAERVTEANKMYEQQELAKVMGKEIGDTINTGNVNAGPVGGRAANTEGITEIHNTPAGKPRITLNPANAINGPGALPAKSNPILSTNASKSEKVVHKITTEGTVDVKDAGLTKIQKGLVKSGKATVRVNRRTGEVSVCKK